MRTTTRILVPLLAGCAVLAAGCNGAPAPTVAPAQPANETFQEFGNYELHFNAVRTDSLRPEIARAYGIQRSANRVMLTVTILRKDAEHAPRKPVEGAVQVDAYNLNGQLKNLEMRRVTEGEAIYYIGEVSISGAEILVFDIGATPSGESAPFKAKLKREFFAD